MKKSKKHKNKQIAVPSKDKELSKPLAEFSRKMEEQTGLKSAPSKALGYKIKLSDTLLKYVKPLLDVVYKLKLDEIQENIIVDETIEQGVFLWNLSFLPYDKAADKLFSALISPFNTQGISMEEVIEQQRSVKPVFEFMYERKQHLFSKDSRFVVNIDKNCFGGSIELNVASLDLKQHPHLLEVFDKKLD